MGQSRVVKRKKFKLVLEPNRWEPNSMYYIRPTINDDVKIYVTDTNGIPFEVEGESGGGIELVRNSDGYLTVSGQNIVTVNISQNLLDLINTKLSQGDNISNLVNDEGYIKLIDVANKLDKVESVTANTQMYVKNPDGTQGMMDVSNLSGISGVKRNGIALPIVSGEVDVIVPETTSDIINDSGYITENEVPIETVTRNGQLLNIVNKNVDVEVPTQTSQLTNDAGFITQADIPPFDDKIEVIRRNGVELPIVNKEVNVPVPTNVSELNNDENFISEVPIETISVNSQNIPVIGKNVNIETITKHSELDLDDGTNPHGTTKTDVGLGNVDNTSDLNKPISTATQDALNNKLDITDNTIKRKSESEYIENTNVGVVNNIELNTENSNIVVNNLTEIKSLRFGVNFKAYAGKEVKIIYNGNGILQITHNASGADVYSKFIFPFGDNYFMLPNEVLTFIVNSDLNSLIFVSSNRRFGQSKVISSSVTLDNSYHGRTLIINGNLTITYPAPNTLHPEFEVCIMTLAYNLTNTPNAAWTINSPNGRNMVHNKIAYVNRVGNTLFFRGEVNV